MKTKDQTFEYQMLARLQNDCEHYLTHGERNVDKLWADNEVDHIDEMFKLYATLDVKPEWITYEQIEQYEKQMVKPTEKPDVKTVHEFCPSSRYTYDFGMCSLGNDFAQFDTSSDAEYFGNWCNPFELIFFSYVEGDCYTTKCDTVNEFVNYVKWAADYYGKEFKGIDAGLGDKLKSRFREIGLGNLLH